MIVASVVALRFALPISISLVVPALVARYLMRRAASDNVLATRSVIFIPVRIFAISFLVCLYAILFGQQWDISDASAVALEWGASVVLSIVALVVPWSKLGF
jgi:hypothetical protein